MARNDQNHDDAESGDFFSPLLKESTTTIIRYECGPRTPILHGTRSRGTLILREFSDSSFRMTTTPRLTSTIPSLKRSSIMWITSRGFPLAVTYVTIIVVVVVCDNLPQLKPAWSLHSSAITCNSIRNLCTLAVNVTLFEQLNNKITATLNSRASTLMLLGLYFRRVHLKKLEELFACPLHSETVS